MPFKLTYNFEGNYRTRPEQNLAGASRKDNLDLLLNRAHEERQKRRDKRIRNQNAMIIQSYVRSFLIRKRKKEEERKIFDANESVLNVKQLMQRVLFFYNSNLDNERLLRICQKLVTNHAEIIAVLDTDCSMSWCIRRVLHLCGNNLLKREYFEICLKCIKIYTDNTNSKTKLQIWSYLISKGLFSKVRTLLDDPSVDPALILFLIQNPLQCVPQISSEAEVELILSEFCKKFLCSTVSPSLKNILIPHLQNYSSFFYKDIIKYLNTAVPDQHAVNVFYLLLAIEPLNHSPTPDSLKVLANFSKDLKSMNWKPEEEDDVSGDDDSDVEEMETSTELVCLQDYIHLLNRSDRVTKLINFFIENSHNDEVLVSVVQLCHNLLLSCKDSIRKFMLLFMLSLKGCFLNKLWLNILRNKSSLQINSISLMNWKDIHKAISVFCDMFTFFTETLTDSDTSDTSTTFSNEELRSMSEILKNMALNMIEVAFSMCSHSNIAPTTEVIRLYYSCLKCVKILYTLDLRKNFCNEDFWTQKKISLPSGISKQMTLSARIKPFSNNTTHKDDEERLPPLTTMEQRSLVILKELPFMVDFNSKVILLRDMCRTSASLPESSIRNFLSGNIIRVRRTHIYEDSFNKLSGQNEINLKKRLKIQFVNNLGLEEAGIDGGGIFKEFVNELLKTSFDPNRGFFLLTNDNMLYPNPNVSSLMENYYEHYYFIGRLLGKAIFETVLVDLPFAEFFLVKLLVDRADSHYLKSLDPVLYRNLLFLRDFDGDVQEMDLDFTLNSDILGETAVIELKPNGKNIPVTNYNRLEYIHKLANYKLNTQIKKQCLAFREGLDSVVPIQWLRMFNHKELQIIISGGNQQINIDDFRAHTTYGGEFNENHETIKLFWKIFDNFSNAQKKQLLKFVTSSTRPPLLGFKELNPKFCIHSSGREDRMPTASTCLNLLKLPVIREEDALRGKLLAAIEQNAGFELS